MPVSSLPLSSLKSVHTVPEYSRPPRSMFVDNKPKTGTPLSSIKTESVQTAFIYPDWFNEPLSPWTSCKSDVFLFFFGLNLNGLELYDIFIWYPFAFNMFYFFFYIFYLYFFYLYTCIRYFATVGDSFIPNLNYLLRPLEFWIKPVFCFPQDKSENTR